MGCAFAQNDFAATGPGAFGGTVTVDGIAYPASMNLADPIITNWTLTVNGATYNADASSTATPLILVFINVAFPCGLMKVTIISGACEEAGEGGANCLACPGLSPTLRVTATGWANVSCGDCSPFEGTVACPGTATDCVWGSTTVTACGTTWEWAASYTGGVWAVHLTEIGGAGGGQYVWALPGPCTLPVTLPLQTGGTTATGCTPPSTVTISE